jgi:hypothetical protein
VEYHIEIMPLWKAVREVSSWMANLSERFAIQGKVSERFAIRGLNWAKMSGRLLFRGSAYPGEIFDFLLTKIASALLAALS